MRPTLFALMLLNLPPSSPLADTATTIFPSHAKDPRQAGGAALLEAVYSGRVRSRKTILRFIGSYAR